MSLRESCPLGKYFTIRSRLKTDLVLEVKDGRDKPGTSVVVNEEAPSTSSQDHQLWYYDSETTTIRSKINQFCLDIGENGGWWKLCRFRRDSVPVLALSFSVAALLSLPLSLSSSLLGGEIVAMVVPVTMTTSQVWATPAHSFEASPRLGPSLTKSLAKKTTFWEGDYNGGGGGGGGDGGGGCEDDDVDDDDDDDDWLYLMIDDWWYISYDNYEEKWW